MPALLPQQHFSPCRSIPGSLHTNIGLRAVLGDSLWTGRAQSAGQCQVRQPGVKPAASSSYQSGPSRQQKGSESTSERLKQGFEEAGNRFRRTAADADHRFDLSGKAQSAATKVREQALALESKFGIQHKLRSLSDDVKRQIPKWTKKYSRFSQTTLGQVTTTVFVVYLFGSGLFFKLLNVLFILWWLLPIIALPLARRRNQQAQAAAQQRRSGQFNMAEELFRQMQGGQFGRQGGARPNPSWQNPSGASKKGRDYSSGGPVIDAEYTTIDDDK